MNWETVIGLETHVELATKSKIFCACTTAFGGAPNTHCCPVCTGMPGALPVLNGKVVEYAVRAALALGCTVTRHSRFDRKNYFYPDLPKAYQVSQLYVPIGVNGRVPITTAAGEKVVRIHELHMEEDAGKLIHDPWTEQTKIDYNRCGVPLIEIVTQPDFRTAEEVVAYLEKLGVVVGYPDGLFHAEATITREQFVAMSVRLDEWMELETYDSRRGSFPDMPVSHWAADYIQEATRNGWIVGYTDGLFHGGDCITRAEVATIVNRMLGRTADERFIRHHEDELTTFRDLQNPHYWAYYDLMEAANGHTIVTGAEDETWHEVR